MPTTIDAALEIAIQRETVEASQKRLSKEKQKAESLVIQEKGCDPLGANAMTRREAGELRQLKELKDQVQQLTVEVARLRASKQPTTSKTGATSWRCGEKGHIRLNCPNKPKD